MTYGIGFKTDKAVFLIADSLISEEPKNKELEELFGQFSTTGRLLEHNTYTFAENLQKVRKITEGMLLTFATNDVSRTLEALGKLKTLIEGNFTLEVAFNSAFEMVKDIEVLFSFSEKDDSKLFSFNLNGDRQINEHHSGEIVAIGSGKQHFLLHENSTKFIVNSIKEMPNETADLLANVLGGLTSFIVSSKLLSALNYDVGGYFFGGYVSGTMIQMSRDTLYLFYAIVDGNLEVKNEISIINSPCMYLVYSHFADNNGRFIAYSNDEKMCKSDRYNEYIQLIENYLEGKLEYAVGIDLQNESYFICKKNHYPRFKFRSFNNATNKMQVGLPPSVVKEIEESYRNSELLSGGYKKIDISKKEI